MKFIPTPLKDAYVIELTLRSDKRGFFARFYEEEEFKKRGMMFTIKHINISDSHKKGTLRGPHFQRAPHEEAKFLRCTKGSLFDVIIDLRPTSPTYKQWFGITLSATSLTAIFAPKGFAHGYLTLEDNTQAMYAVDEVYHPQSEGGIRYNDPTFNIAWPIPVVYVSQKDLQWPNFKP